jgi:hypothetical protein
MKYKFQRMGTGFQSMGQKYVNIRCSEKMFLRNLQAIGQIHRIYKSGRFAIYFLPIGHQNQQKQIWCLIFARRASKSIEADLVLFLARRASKSIEADLVFNFCP